MENRDRLRIRLATPDNKRAIIMTGHELLAVAEPADRAHRLRRAVEAHLAPPRPHIPQHHEPTLKADEQLGRVQRVVTQVHHLARLALLRQLDRIVPLDVVARLREVVVHVEHVGVALCSNIE